MTILRDIQETLGTETWGMLDPLLLTFRTALLQRLTNQLLAIYISGTAEMVTWGTTKAGIPIAYEGPPIQQAITWAEKHAAQLVTQMDEETKRRLAQVVSDGIKNKRGVPGLARDLRQSFGNMSTYRSQMIARTETANALSQSSLDTMKNMGIEGKEWVTVGDDRVSPECLGNEAEGVIPTKQAFSSGLMAPPQHPNCRCALAPARLKGKAAQPDLPKSTASQQAEYRSRMDADILKADRDIKRVNDDFMAGKTSLAKNQAQRDAINAELDKKANKVRAEMGF